MPIEEIIIEHYYDYHNNVVPLEVVYSISLKTDGVKSMVYFITEKELKEFAIIHYNFGCQGFEIIPDKLNNFLFKRTIKYEEKLYQLSNKVDALNKELVELKIIYDLPYNKMLIKSND